MTKIILLGPQQRIPTFHSVLKALAIDGPICAITAGWQEDEGDTEELTGYAAYKITDLKLYHRAEEVYAHDSALFQANRQRQNELQELQRLYRIQLTYALDAARDLLQEEGDSALLNKAQRSALALVRAVDHHHLRQIRKIHDKHEQHWRTRTRTVIDAQRRQLAKIIAASQALLVAGGHVASLLNRLRLFEMSGLLRDIPIIAWSAGAMALADRVVLFHDRPPQGAGNAELLDIGLDVYKHVIPLPNAQHRLVLDDPLRVGLFARRFAPALCITLDETSIFHWNGAQPTKTQAVKRLLPSGQLSLVEAV